MFFFLGCRVGGEVESWWKLSFKAGEVFFFWPVLSAAPSHLTQSCSGQAGCASHLHPYQLPMVVLGAQSPDSSGHTRLARPPSSPRLGFPPASPQAAVGIPGEGFGTARPAFRSSAVPEQPCSAGGPAAHGAAQRGLAQHGSRSSSSRHERQAGRSVKKTAA